MKHQDVRFNRTTIESRELTPTGLTRPGAVGQITAIDHQKGEVLVNFDGNPANRSIPAKVTSQLNLQQLMDAFTKKRTVRLDFCNNTLTMPIITDIFISILDLKKKQQDVSDKEIHIKAKRIVMEGTEEIVIKSGSAQTVYDAKTGQLKDNADHVSSDARISNKIKGGSVLLN